MANNTNSTTFLKYYIATSFAVIGWGLSTSFVEFGLPFVNPYLFLALRFLLALLLVTPYILLKKRKEVLSVMKSRWPYIIAICETTGLLFQYLGQNLDVAAGLSSLLTMMFILEVPVLSTVLLHEKFYRNHAIAIVLGLIGLFFIITEGDISRLVSSSILGIVLLLLSATSYAFYQLTTSKYTRGSETDVDSIALFYVVMLLITTYSWLMAFVNSSVTLAVPIDGWIWIGMLAIFSTIFAFTGYFEASKGIPANTLAIILMSQMLVPFFVDVFFLHMNYSLWVYCGAIIIVLGMYFVAKIPLDESTNNNSSLNKASQSENNLPIQVQPGLLK